MKEQLRNIADCLDEYAATIDKMAAYQSEFDRPTYYKLSGKLRVKSADIMDIVKRAK